MQTLPVLISAENIVSISCHCVSSFLTNTLLQFVYLRDNLLSSLEGIEILKRVKVCFLDHNILKFPRFRKLPHVDGTNSFSCKTTGFYGFLGWLLLDFKFLYH